MKALFDTSMLKWAYLPGTKLCRRCRNVITRAKGEAFVAEITVIEIVSALASMARDHKISAVTFAKANDLFLKDLAERRISVVPFPSSQFIACRDLLTIVGLRAGKGLKTQDAMVAYTARRLAVERGERVRVYTSDKALARIIAGEPTFKGLVESKYLAP